jgi:hypothetical protein
MEWFSRKTSISNWILFFGGHRRNLLNLLIHDALSWQRFCFPLFTPELFYLRPGPHLCRWPEPSSALLLIDSFADPSPCVPPHAVRTPALPHTRVSGTAGRFSQSREPAVPFHRDLSSARNFKSLTRPTSGTRLLQSRSLSANADRGKLVSYAYPAVRI